MQETDEDVMAETMATYEDDMTAAPYLVPQLASGSSHIEVLGELSDSDSQVMYDMNEEPDEAAAHDASGMSDGDNEETSDVEDDGVSLPQEDDGADDEEAEGTAEDQEGQWMTQAGSAPMTSHDTAAASHDGTLSCGAPAQDDFANAFAFSRVKELLKLESEGGVVAREATLATCEALALMLRDLTSAAAAEATRQGRKTITYDDLARVVQLYDRFAYLADVLPPRMLATGAGGRSRATHPTSAAAASSIARATQNAPFGLRSQRSAAAANSTPAALVRNHKARALADRVGADAGVGGEATTGQPALRQTTLPFAPA